MAFSSSSSSVPGFSPASPICPASGIRRSKSWIFGPVWTLLYVLIAIAGARIWLKAPRSAAMQLWFAQIALNMLWSPSFFGLENPGLALVVIVMLLATIVVFMRKAEPIDRPSMLLFIPYLAWVSFATLLNASIFLLN